MDGIAPVPVSGPQVWRGPDVARRGDWIGRIPERVIADLDAVVDEVRARSIEAKTFAFEDVRVPSLDPLADEVRAALHDGYGFRLLRGIPVERYSLDELKCIFLVIGHHFGLVGPQVGMAKGIGEVMDFDSRAKREYYFHVGGPLPMHMDPIDVVGLMCVRAAKHGGASGIVSSMAVHNAILAERPDLLSVLYRGFRHIQRHARTADGGRMLTDYDCPVFSDLGDEIACTWIPSPIELAVGAGLLDLGARDREAIDYLAATATRPDLVLHMDLEPGDIQFLNNRLILHNRTDYEDYPEPERKRLLLRLWLTMPGWTKFPPLVPRHDVELGTSPP